MSILTVTNVAKSFGADLLFSDITFSLAAGQKMGLVGRNGGGKTTLLKILLGQETPDVSMNQTARVALASGRRMGYLRQEAPVHPQHTILEEIEDALAPIRAVQKRIAEAEHAMSDAKDEMELEAAMASYTVAYEDFESRGGYGVEDQRDAILLRLGFGPENLSKKVGACSGGEQTRLALAKLVLMRPDLLILDEPTNHLDIAATEWLEGFLKEYEGAILLVSHDRYFLDAVTDTTAELEFQKMTLYKGNYSSYRQQKADQQSAQMSLYNTQQKEVKRLENLISRNMGADANASNIRHKTQGRIARMDNVEIVKNDKRRVKAKVDTAGAGRVGREVVRLSDLQKIYGPRTLFSHLNAVIERDDRVGLVGPNGSGKTTIVKILRGEEKPTAGSLDFGNNVRMGYFSQHATDALDTQRTVLESLTDVAKNYTETMARNYLARFLFTGDDVMKVVGMLSGGEKNKLALARLLLEPCNFLILDEPTNHLDIESCENLTQMLEEYEGTLLLVSHDRYLLNAITTKTFGFIPKGTMHIAEGNYSLWREEIEELIETPEKLTEKLTEIREIPKPALTNVTAPINPLTSGMSARDLSKARVKAKEVLDKAEENVQKKEAALTQIETKLTAGDPTSDLIFLAAEHTRLGAEVEAALAAWEKATADCDSLI